MNIEERLKLVKETIDGLAIEKLSYSEIRDIIYAAKEQMKIIETSLEHEDVDAPICCYNLTKKDGKIEIGCGKWVGEDRDEWVWNFYGPVDDFVKYCKTCRGNVKKELPLVREKMERIERMYGIDVV